MIRLQFISTLDTRVLITLQSNRIIPEMGRQAYHGPSADKPTVIVEILLER